MVAQRVGDQTVVYHIPSIVPRQRDDGRCVFLNDQNLCEIHEVSPYGCAYHDSHRPKAEADKISLYAIHEQARGNEPGESYGEWHALLTALGRTATPVAERVTNYERALRET